MSVATLLEQLAPTFTGRLLQPADAGYDDARRVHNGLIDKRPALIARCHGTADVVDAVKLARTLNLEIAVRGGGHNVGGRGTIDSGLMIDLAPMKGIHVSPTGRTARAQGGVLWKEFNRETQLHGLATTGGVVGTTGIAGLTLGGGLGWLMPKYGLALDNLKSVEVVMADGSVRRASADENADLFWAIRGGGGNFGIVTSFKYTLHSVGPMIAGGLVAHPFPNGKDVLRFFRDTCESLPDEMMMVAGLMTAPDGSGNKLVGLVAAHAGSLAAGEAALKPIKAFGPPVLDAMGPICVLRPEQPARRLDSPRRAELLEGALREGSERRLHRRDSGRLREVPVADEPDRHRALPRRGEPRTRGGHRLRNAGHGLQRRHRLAVDRREGHRGRHRLGAGLLYGSRPVSRDDALRELPGHG